MNQGDFDKLGQFSMMELFRMEAENQAAIMTSGLLELERGPAATQTFDMLMRAAHSLKGAARFVNLRPVERLAHGLEDIFVAAQHGGLALQQTEIDMLFRGLDLLSHLAKLPEASLVSWEAAHGGEFGRYLESLAELVRDRSAAECHVDRKNSQSPRTLTVAPAIPERGVSAPRAHTPRPIASRLHDAGERSVRLTAESLNRLLSLAAESLAESHWLHPFAESLEHLRQKQQELGRQLESVRRAIDQEKLSGPTQNQLTESVCLAADCRQQLDQRLQELDLFERRSAHLSQRLYLEVLRTRTRPFGDGLRRFPRMVRDLARTLGKEVTLEVLGDNTQVDRDLLERLETPLAHLLRNAVDHGCETPAERVRAGKHREGTIRLEARHCAGKLLVTVSDDGAGVPPERLRKAVLQKKLAPPSVAERLTETELLEFLLLPGFTLKETVTEISGRGVGLDAVHNITKTLRGTVRLSNQAGHGLRIQLQLPLTLSVVRALLVQIADETYAFPLNQVSRVLKLDRGSIRNLEGTPDFELGGQRIGLLSAHQLLECGKPASSAGDFSVIMLGDKNGRHGLPVDQVFGERELVVQPLDARLGLVKHISSAAVLEDGTPVLIVDVNEVLRSIENLVSSGHLAREAFDRATLPVPRQKRVLAVDDSFSVREMERKVMISHGYLAEVAVDGLDGWNAVRQGRYDLVITDVDMPGMDGIELAMLIKQDPQLKSLPVMIVSYKDGEEDRLRGLKAGADYYLAKGSFDEGRLLQAVVDLIGGPDA